MKKALLFLAVIGSLAAGCVVARPYPAYYGPHYHHGPYYGYGYGYHHW